MDVAAGGGVASANGHARVVRLPAPRCAKAKMRRHIMSGKERGAGRRLEEILPLAILLPKCAARYAAFAPRRLGYGAPLSLAAAHTARAFMRRRRRAGLLLRRKRGSYCWKAKYLAGFCRLASRHAGFM